MERIDVFNPNPEGGKGWKVVSDKDRDKDATGEGGVILIGVKGEYVLTGSTDVFRVEVAWGVKCTLILDNCHIRSSHGDALSLNEDGCDVTLRLIGNNGLMATGADSNGYGYGYSGIAGYGDLTIEDGGDGSLTAKGGDGDYYGDDYYGDGGKGIYAKDISISGGTITATGGNGYDRGGDGIFSLFGSISISGGTVTVTGGFVNEDFVGKGICARHNLAISGGNINATGDYAGIGCYSPLDSKFNSTLTIAGGNINATGTGCRGRGIGAQKIVIEDGHVIAKGNDRGIGVDTITINGGNVTAKGDNIGMGGINITINGGHVTAEGKDDDHSECTGISTWNNLTINGGDVMGKGYKNGIFAFRSDGCGDSLYRHDPMRITIAGGNVTAEGKNYGIGCDPYFNFTISGGKVNAIGEYCGIGNTLDWDNYHRQYGNPLTISGGHIKANTIFGNPLSISGAETLIEADSVNTSDFGGATVKLKKQ